MPGDYSSSVSGDRPEEVERIRKRLEEVPDGPELEWTGYFNGAEYVNGGSIPTPPGPPITEPWWGEGKAPGWDQPDTTTGIELTRADAVRSEVVRWLWPGRIPLGKITVVDGDPKLGKTTMVLDLIARVSTGSPMPDGLPGYEGNCLVMSTEDAPSDTIKPRLMAAGADLTRVHIQTGEAAVYLSTHLAALEAAITRFGFCLCMIDPLMGYLGPEVNSNRDQDVRQVMGPLAGMAGRLGCAIVLIRHLNKSPTSNTQYRGGGSIGIIGAARSALLVAKVPDADPDDPNPKRVVASNGGNLSSVPPSLSFRMETANVMDDGLALTPVRLAWDPTPVAHTAATLLAPPRDRRDDGSRVGMAMGWLAEQLKDGAVAYDDLAKMAAQEEISETILRKARKELPGSGWFRDGFGKGSVIYWHLAGKTTPRKDPKAPKPRADQSSMDL